MPYRTGTADDSQRRETGESLALEMTHGVPLVGLPAEPCERLVLRYPPVWLAGVRPGVEGTGVCGLGSARIEQAELAGRTRTRTWAATSGTRRGDEMASRASQISRQQPKGAFVRANPGLPRCQEPHPARQELHAEIGSGQVPVRLDVLLPPLLFGAVRGHQHDDQRRPGGFPLLPRLGNEGGQIRE